MLTGTFVDVGEATEKFDLTKLTVGGKYASGDVNVQTLTSVGATDKMYSFIKDRKDNWYWKNDDTGETIAEGDVVFESGDGLWVGGVDTATLTIAGAVSAEDHLITLQDGFTATGNMTPVEIDLTGIIPGGKYESGDINIQTLTASGATDKMYSFVKDRKDNWYWKNDDTGDTIAEGDVKFAAGAGLWISGVDGATLTIQAPTL